VEGELALARADHAAARRRIADHEQRIRVAEDARLRAEAAARKTGAPPTGFEAPRRRTDEPPAVKVPRRATGGPTPTSPLPATE
jgi:hypothetical protein